MHQLSRRRTVYLIAIGLGLPLLAVLLVEPAGNATLSCATSSRCLGVFLRLGLC